MTARHALSALGALLALGACASLEPDPCTPEWVDYKTDQILDPFVREYRSEISVLRDLSGEIDNPSMLTAFRLAGQADTIAYMFEDFRETAVPQVQAAVAQCQEPRMASQLLVGMLERQGVEPDVLAWIEAIGVLADGFDGAERRTR